MVAAAQPAIVGVIELVLISLTPVAVFFIIFHLRPIAEFAMRVGRKIKLVPPPKPEPAGPPLERIAADIRRIAAHLESLPPRAPAIRRQGIVLAYDEALCAACRALDVEDTLTRMPIGAGRDSERFRVECELEYAGLVIAPPRAA